MTSNEHSDGVSFNYLGLYETLKLQQSNWQSCKNQIKNKAIIPFSNATVSESGSIITASYCTKKYKTYWS